MLGLIGRVAALAALLAGGQASAQTLLMRDLERPAIAASDGVEAATPVRLGAGLFALQPGDRIDLSDFDDGELSVRLDRIEAHALGGRSWIGRIEAGDGLRRVILTEVNGAVFGSIDTPDGFYALRSDADGDDLVMVASSPMGDLAPGDDAIRIQAPRLPGPVREEARQPVSADVEPGELGFIDIGIVYTDGMRDYYGLGLPARLQFLATVYDQALIDSETGARGRLAWIGPPGSRWDDDVSTIETIDDLFAGASFGSPGSEPDVVGTCSDFDGICENNGDLSGLFAVREGKAIDLMIMLRRYRPNLQVFCGVAYLPMAPGEGDIDPSDRIYGVAVSGDGPDVDGSSRNCGEGGTFSHELGHNMGAVHNFENTTVEGVFGFAYGHRVDCDFRTIMGYDSQRSGVSCPGIGPNERWVMVYSNPEVDLCGGAPASAPGSPNDNNTAPTNVALAIRQEGHEVQNFYGPPPRAVRSAVLPHGRVAQTNGEPVTAFVSLINPAASGGTATQCGLSLHGARGPEFSYQTTDPATNALTGTPNTPVDIPAGGVQTYLIDLRRSELLAEHELQIDASCLNRRSAVTVAGVNTFRLAAIGAPPTDIIALAATPGNTGAITLPSTTGTGAFAVAISNVGAASTVTIIPQAGPEAAALGGLTVCETDPATGACLTSREGELSQPIGAGETRTYAVFVTAAGAVAADPARNRVYLNFRSSGGLTLGSTSVAVQTP